MDRIAFALVNDFQREFPLVSRPFRVLARHCGTDEADVLQRLRALCAIGAIGRIGAVVARGLLGASTLSALPVPPHRLAAVAESISALPEVNHNYAREHHYNLWFVASAADRAALTALLARIEAMTGLRPLDLPLAAEYHIDLGFDLSNVTATDASMIPSPPCGGSGRGMEHALPGRPPRYAPDKALPRPASRAITRDERRLLDALQDGLEIVAEPFRALAAKLETQEAQLLSALDRCIEDGIIRRFGVIVRHHELGFRANAMAVWDVPDALVDGCGLRAARVPGVTLAYRRRRQLPEWPYNLFCMVHSKERGSADQTVREIAMAAHLERYPHRVLFSTRRFKQCGARYRHPQAIAHG